MLEGEKMIGAVVFVIAFVLVTLISLAVKFPPGTWIVQKWISNLPQEYNSLVTGIINGVFYGVIIWVVFSVAKMAWERKKGKKQPAEKGP